MTALPIKQPLVPRLHHGLDRVLFNQGVYKLQDPYSMVYNFDPYLQEIMPVTEFDYNALAEYKTSSQDGLLSSMAKEHSIKYVGSTSSMTSALGHFHYLLSNWRPIKLDMLSKEFPEKSTTFTEINRAPNSIFLRWKNGNYAIDADKQYDGANVLMLLGKSLEKLLTMSPSEFERYRKSDPRKISSAEREAPESFHFSTQGDFLMRSQLDAHDPRLPGTGMFDLKTRAVVSVRMQADDYEEMSGYELHQQHGRFESYEREYYDMIRSTMLKYSLQARMGRMDGIFVAYHNVKRIFGFQYLNLNEMDKALHGQSDRCLGNQEFSLSIDMLNKILDKATERYPDQTIRFHFETRPSTLPFMYIFAEPVSEDEADEIQNSQKEKVKEYERAVMGLDSRSSERSSEQADMPSEENLTAKESLLPEATEIESGTLRVTDTRPSASDVAAASENESPADPDLPSLVTPETKTIEENLRPLLAMTLTVRSRVNGNYVERPENLGPQDKWKVEYSLAEIPLPSRAWSLYEATKARRKKIFDRVNSTDDDKLADEEKKSARRGDGYIELLKELSRKGRELRNNIEEATVDKEKVVVGEPYGKPGNTMTHKRGDVEINGVDDYLGWLFDPAKKH
ncbi:mitochondrial protein Pet127-domain-containing protein [Delphinella strobiligena]|nr:mitochondrial protein Pet127-domain-containing protein [Delphinella strobiligena]